MLFRRSGSPISPAITPLVANVSSLKATDETLKQLEQALNRRRFLTGLGAAGAVAGAAVISGCGSSSMAKAQSTSTADTVQQIFTAALIAEDLAITMYYNALVGGVIQDPNLSGTGGSATNVTANGSLANVGYLRGALVQCHRCVAMNAGGHPAARAAEQAGRIAATVQEYDDLAAGGQVPPNRLHRRLR